MAPEVVDMFLNQSPDELPRIDQGKKMLFKEGKKLVFHIFLFLPVRSVPTEVFDGTEAGKCTVPLD